MERNFAREIGTKADTLMEIAADLRAIALDLGRCETARNLSACATQVEMAASHATISAANVHDDKQAKR